MKGTDTASSIDFSRLGQEMFSLMVRLYPIFRSITGEGVRETLRILQEFIPLTIHEVPTGTKVFDWTVPREWVIRDAYIKNSRGERVVDLRNSNLHVLNYSSPVRKILSREELSAHLFTIPEHPDWIPYLTTYYHENWGFCLSHRQLESMDEATYEVCINSELKTGSLTYGEFLLPGKNKEEILFSTYICHPSLCNDNLSGPVLLTFLSRLLNTLTPTYTYRFLFIPETIGAITWLSLNEGIIGNIRGGLVATCVGDRGISTYQRSRQGSAMIDRIAETVLRDCGKPYRIREFVPYGSDERQFSSPGFNLPIGSLMRTPYGEPGFPEYHTSADNPRIINPENLADSLQAYREIVTVLEQDGVYRNLNPKCEPQLGRRGVYSRIGSQKGDNIRQYAMLWILNLSDGTLSLLDIAIRSGLRFREIREAADTLLSVGLIEPQKSPGF